jgi:hypothetical protein
VQVADVNGDGKQDLIFSNRFSVTAATGAAGVTGQPYGNSTIGVALGNGDGSFGLPEVLQDSVNIFTGQNQPTAFAVADLNGDGTPDLVVPNAANTTAAGNVTAQNTFSVWLNESATRTVLTSSGNPSLVGLPVTFSAVVVPLNPIAPYTPRGTVTFIVDGAVAAVANVGPGGVATYTTTTLSAQTHSVRAVFNGDGSYFMSSSGTLIQTVILIPSTLTVTVSPNPAISGQSATVSVKVSGAGPFPPSGGVVILDNGVAVGTAALNASGQATFTLTRPSVGKHTITVTYPGSSFYLPSSGATILTVQTASTSLFPVFATGTDAGGAPLVNVYDGRTGALRFSFLAYPPTFTGGVRVAVGDVNGDGTPDIITAPGPHSAPVIEVWDGLTQRLIMSCFAFTSPGSASSANTNTPSAAGNVAGSLFTGGAFVAAGDVNGDGFADIIVGADAGGGPQVEVFDGHTFNVIASFFALPATFTGGVHVAAGDLNGDGLADIIVGAGRGGGPAVLVFNGANDALMTGFYPLPATFPGGVFVATGDVNGDGKLDIITGAGPGGGPLVQAFDGTTQAPLLAFYAFSPAFRGGVRVASQDLNGNGFSDIITSAGPTSLSQVVAFDGQTLAMLLSFDAYPGFRGGVWVG